MEKKIWDKSKTYIVVNYSKKLYYGGNLTELQATKLQNSLADKGAVVLNNYGNKLYNRIKNFKEVEL